MLFCMIDHKRHIYFQEQQYIFFTDKFVQQEEFEDTKGLQRHFQQYFSYIVAVSFIGRENRSTRRKPLTCRKSLTNFIT